MVVLVVRESGWFVWKQAQSSVFALLIFASLAASFAQPFPRYDFLLAACFAIQWFLVRRGLESLAELKLICVFHVLGLALEAYKVSRGSWSYPEPAFTKLLDVPLYAGFMYASVASYIVQAWKRFELEFTHLPSSAISVSLCAGIYLNFALSHFIGDFRWLLAAGLGLAFRRSMVHFTVSHCQWRMPTLLALTLIGGFVWIAENLCTKLGAWQYPYQAEGWSLVHPMKIFSWTLMVVIAFVIVRLWRVGWERSTAALPVER